MIGRIKNRLVKEFTKLRSFSFVKKCQFQARYAGGEFTHSSKIHLNCPVRCDGAGLVSLKEKVSIGYRKAPILGNGEVLLQARRSESIITIGSGTITSNNISIIACAEINIGSNCQIGDLVSIYDCDFHEIDPETRNNSAGEVNPVRIGNNIWLGSRVMVLKGVTIGNNSVIAAGSIVTKSIPSNSLAGGIPAKVIRKI